MACRIGITTDLAARKKYWESKHPTLHNWQKLAGPTTRTEAQALETKLAKQQGCEAHPGGDEPDKPGAVWNVYRFDY